MSFLSLIVAQIRVTKNITTETSKTMNMVT